MKYYSMVYYDILIMIYYDVLWYIMMHHDIIWYNGYRWVWIYTGSKACACQVRTEMEQKHLGARQSEAAARH